MVATLDTVDPLEALLRVAYLQDRGLYPSRKTAAFLKAAALVEALGIGELEQRVARGTLLELGGIGPSTAAVITQALAGEVPERIIKLEAETQIPLGAGIELRSLIKGDCHAHSTWSDGGASIETMALAAQALGHEYLVVTDHSPRLTVAHGLNRDRLVRQIAEIDELNSRLAPFRVLTGIEVDILVDGTLDQDEDILEQLDFVVASVHSKLSMQSDQMTDRVLAAVSSPHVDALGHCTGRMLKGSGDSLSELRPRSTFNFEAVFEACATHGTAVEINCRPERQDPPPELLDLALDAGCYITISTDSHSPGHLEFLNYGCDKAMSHGISTDRILNTRTAEDLVAWTRDHASA